LDGITPGVGEASKCLVLDANADILSGINDFNIDGNLYSKGGTLDIGELAVVAGMLTAYGEPTGSVTGGSVVLHTADDHDSTIPSYGLAVSSDDLLIGPSTDPNALEFRGATDQFAFTHAAALLVEGAGGIHVGLDDTQAGTIYVYGHATGNAGGGQIALWTAADYDTSIEAYQFAVNEDDLTIGPNGDPDALMYDGANNRWDFTHSAALVVSCANGMTVSTGPLNVTPGIINVGTNDVLFGSLNLYGHGTGSNDGGKIKAYLAADYDTTIQSYSFDVEEDDLLIGPNTDPDAFMFDGGLNQIILSPTAGVAIRGGNSLTIGVDDSGDGTLIIYGGSSDGGTLRLHVGAAYDTTIENYGLTISGNADLWFGPNTDADALIYDSTNNRWDFSAAGGVHISDNNLFIGKADNNAGDITMYSGIDTASPVLTMIVAPDYDSVITQYTIKPSMDDFKIGPSNDDDALKYDGATAAWHFSAVGGLHVIDNDLFIGADDSNAGRMTMYSGIDTASPRITMIIAPDYDTTITQYTIGPNQDDFTIGPSNDSDALKYDGANARWDFTTAVATQFSGAGGIDVTAGAVSVGVEDTIAGEIVLFGQATGSPTGGLVEMQMSADYDTTYSHGFIGAVNARLQIGINGWNLGAIVLDPALDYTNFVEGVNFKVDGIKIATVAMSATAPELNLLDGVVAAVVFSPSGGAATGTNALTFNDAAGAKLAIPTAGTMYFSSLSTGLDFLPITTSVVTSKGEVDKEGGQAGADVFHFVTDGAGELDFTVTAAADDYYCVIILPTGKLAISAVMTLTG
jgi:hypothetical protein